MLVRALSLFLAVSSVGGIPSTCPAEGHAGECGASLLQSVVQNKIVQFVDSFGDAGLATSLLGDRLGVEAVAQESTTAAAVAAVAVRCSTYAAHRLYLNRAVAALSAAPAKRLDKLVDEFIDKQSGSADACHSQLMEARHQLNQLHTVVTDLANRVNSTEEILAVYGKELKQKLEEVEALEKWKGEEDLKCDEKQKADIEMFRVLSGELTEMHQIASPGVAMDIDGRVVHEAGFLQVASDIDIEASFLQIHSIGPVLDAAANAYLETPSSKSKLTGKSMSTLTNLIQDTRDASDQFRSCVQAKPIECQFSTPKCGKSPGPNSIKGNPFPRSSLKACEELCLSKKDCKAIIFRKEKKTCFILSRTYNANYQKDVKTDGVVSNVKDNAKCTGLAAPTCVKGEEQAATTTAAAPADGDGDADGDGAPTTTAAASTAEASPPGGNSTVSSSRTMSSSSSSSSSNSSSSSSSSDGDGGQEPLEASSPTECAAQKETLEKTYVKAYVELSRLKSEYDVLANSTDCQDRVQAEYDQRIVVQEEADRIANMVPPKENELRKLRPQLESAQEAETKLRMHLATLAEECEDLGPTISDLDKVRDAIRAMKHCPGLSRAKFSLPKWTGIWVHVSLDAETQSDEEQDAAMQAACQASIPGSRAAEVAEIQEHTVEGIPRTNTAPNDLMGTCSGCEGDEDDTYKSGHARVCWATEAELLPGGRKTQCAKGKKSCLCVVDRPDIRNIPGGSSFINLGADAAKSHEESSIAYHNGTVLKRVIKEGMEFGHWTPTSVVGFNKWGSTAEFATTALEGKEFVMYAWRNSPITLRLYALDQASVTIKKDGKDFKSGKDENTTIEVAQGKVETVTGTTGGTIEIISTGGIIVTYQANNADFLQLPPASETVFGSCSTVCWITTLGREKVEVTEECTNGKTKKLNGNLIRLTTTGSFHSGIACKYTANGTKIGGVSYNDGNGGDAISFLDAQHFQHVTPFARDMAWVKFVSDQPAMCAYGEQGPFFSLTGSKDTPTVYQNYKTDDAEIKAGTVITCDKPVMVYGDDKATSDEFALYADAGAQPCPSARLVLEAIANEKARRAEMMKNADIVLGEVPAFKVMLAPGRCTTPKIIEACKEKGLTPLCDQKAYSNTKKCWAFMNAPYAGKHLSHPTHDRQMGIDPLQLGGMCFYSVHGQWVLWNDGFNVHRWSNTMAPYKGPDGTSHSSAALQDKTGWPTLCVANEPNR